MLIYRLFACLDGNEGYGDNKIIVITIPTIIITIVLKIAVTV